jgi:hypothetical protein
MMTEFDDQLRVLGRRDDDETTADGFELAICSGPEVRRRRN